jgi:hypothetical protein
MIAETIDVEAGGSVSAGNVSLTAVSDELRTVDPAAITSDALAALGLSSPADLLSFDPSTVDPATVISAINSASQLGSLARITVRDPITASGDITMSARAENPVALSAAIGGNTILFRDTRASISVENTQLDAGGAISISATNSGDRGSFGDAVNVIINVGIDEATASRDPDTGSIRHRPSSSRWSADRNQTNGPRSRHRKHSPPPELVSVER